MNYISRIRRGTIEVDNVDVKVKFQLERVRRSTSSSIRKEITEFSHKSRNRLIYKARNMGQIEGFNTLTYHENWVGLSGEDCKRHLSNLRKRLLRKYPDIMGLWFFEFQKRGAPHFHILTSTAIPSDWLKSAWNAIVDPDNEQHLEHGADAQILRKRHAAGSYAAKYSGKNEQKQVPENFEKVGRFWGMFGVIKVLDSVIAMKGNKDFYALVRVLRKAHRKHVQSYGGKWRKHGHGIVGFTAWDVSDIANQYLSSVYEFLDSPQKLILEYSPRRIDSSNIRRSLMQPVELCDSLL